MKRIAELVEALARALASNNQPEYKFYVWSPKLKKIMSGWEFREDAKDDVLNQNQQFAPFKVLTRTFLISQGVSPDNDAMWHGGMDEQAAPEQPAPEQPPAPEDDAAVDEKAPDPFTDKWMNSSADMAKAGPDQQAKEVIRKAYQQARKAFEALDNSGVDLQHYINREILQEIDQMKEFLAKKSKELNSL